MSNEKSTKNMTQPPDQEGDKPRRREKGNLFDWVDAGLKVVIALIGIWISYLGYGYQKSFTASQLLVQQKKGDTDIRAQMFGKITDRLMRPEEKGKTSLLQDTLLAQMLALNFHELIELKPLMLDLDNRLSIEIEKLKEAGTDNPNLQEHENALNNLRSAARRIRDRQVATLICDVRPDGDEAASTYNRDEGKGSIRYISVVRRGSRNRNLCAVKEDAGQNGCFKEVMELPGPSGNQAMYISIDKADWLKENFTVSLNPDMPKRKIVLPPGYKPGDQENLPKAQECLEKPDLKPLMQTSNEPGHKTFVVTWYDFPFTDNTLQANGGRYAVFIDQVCKEAFAKPNDEPNSVRLGILYFPKDYFPSRERPVSYKQLSGQPGLD